MLFRVDPSSSVPLVEQISGNVRQHLVNGTITTGDRLPAARELADSLGVNMHTVLKAYAALRDEGLLELRRGRGAVITATHPADSARMSAALREVADAARRMGLGADDVVQLVRKALP
ncbi:GntR family transcriptional regulator [Amycolatopsis suaedae]|uniref:GntR family transcriptional regulator n=1 Tax=Amycolatopsis suaedae TaxID=2510978 RepID=A0A4Q7JEI5_9PSEU|nr:GntR family transcriptional regulator [Amycolatopsis suaedae]RZQ65708.1 GntR family transcriptional regulator [Amycolatopsis suaedae]